MWAYEKWPIDSKISVNVGGGSRIIQVRDSGYLKASVAPSAQQHSGDAARHRVDEIPHELDWNRIPDKKLLPELRFAAGPRLLPQFAGHVCPQVLDRIQVGGIARPLQCLHVFLGQVSSAPCVIGRSFVLLEDEVPAPWGQTGSDMFDVMDYVGLVFLGVEIPRNLAERPDCAEPLRRRHGFVDRVWWPGECTGENRSPDLRVTCPPF